MHTSHKASDSGLDQEKIKNVFNYQQCDLFTEREKAAIEIAISGGSVPNSTTLEHFEKLKKFFSPKEIIDIVSVIALFGFLNRWNDTFKTPIEEFFNN